jgi:hypothetical protein
MTCQATALAYLFVSTQPQASAAIPSRTTLPQTLLALWALIRGEHVQKLVLVQLQKVCPKWCSQLHTEIRKHCVVRCRHSTCLFALVHRVVNVCTAAVHVADIKILLFCCVMMLLFDCSLQPLTHRARPSRLPRLSLSTTGGI